MRFLSNTHFSLFYIPTPEDRFSCGIAHIPVNNIVINWEIIAFVKEKQICSECIRIVKLKQHEVKVSISY